MDEPQPSTSKHCDEASNAQTEAHSQHETVVLNELKEDIDDVMLNYERQIFIDLLDLDALVICAKGLNTDTILLNLLRVHCDPGNLILIINATDLEEQYYTRKLNSAHVYASDTRATLNQREETYLNGGIHFVSTRVLVVAMLKKRIPIDKITGIFVLRAHTILESCQEAFALRLFRHANKTGFIKAFSNCARSFTVGYGHVERVMRCLFVKELHLWPRFHSVVLEDLKKYEPVVIELHVDMRDTRRDAQTCILDLMNQLVAELKRLNRLVDLQEITVENCITKKFHKILENQLDCVWYQLSDRTRQLVAELKTLRHLMATLIHSDAVTFYGTLMRYMTPEYTTNAIWVALNSADQLFSLAKKMIYKNVDKLELNPQFCPKWEALNEILTLDIPADVKKMKEHNVEEPVKILILCNDTNTCYLLNQILSYNPQMYTFYNVLRYKIPYLKVADTFAKQINANFTDKTDPKIIEQKVSQMLHTHESTRTQLVEPQVKKAKVNEESDESQSQGTLSGLLRDLDDDGILNTRSTYVLKVTQTEKSHEETLNVTTKKRKKEEDIDESNLNVTFQPMSLGDDYNDLDLTEILAAHNTSSTTEPTESKDPIVFIQTFKNKSDRNPSLKHTLINLQPNYVIMYHNDMAAIRQIEVYEAKNQRRRPLKVYFLVYNGTVEEQSYLTTLRREKEAFEYLIEQKAKMVIPTYQDGKTEDCLALHREIKETPEKNTRKAGGQLEEIVTRPKVIVDMREFRSELPALIHRRGIEIEPITICIGDYILTPDICVERKSISDLIQSLNSGRLYNQCQQMTRFYSTPMLLIEFDQNKPFHLQGSYMVSSDAKNNDILQKLQLLTLHFPKLKLIWSPSPYATAQLFEELKDGKSQPDSEYAAKVSSETDLEVLEKKYNSVIYDLMQKLPGVTTKNIEMVLKHGKNLSHMSKMSVTELQSLVGNPVDAKQLYAALHETHAPHVEGKSQKTFNRWKSRDKFKSITVNRK